jgi:hypothetical protein
MPYKILTYTNPYEINKTSYWNDIKDLPHFCVARTLVNGLVDVMQDSIGGLICPLDDLVKHERVYKEWVDNISRRIEQYSYLTKLFDATKKKSNDPRREPFFSALGKNQSQFLDAIRLFIELNISASSLHPDLALKEQKAFVRVLSKIQVEDEQLFRFPKTPDLSTLKRAIDELAVQELEDYKKEMALSGRSVDPKHEQWLRRNISTTQNAKLTGIIVHGVHQFSPAQIRLITDLEKQGLTIYFLFNYQPKYSAIYDSWMNIYGNFEVKVETDGKECAMIPPEYQTESYALATALGLLCEGKYSPANPDMRASYEKYKTCEFLKFANLTEYAHFVAACVGSAKKKYYDGLSPLERGAAQNSSRAILGRLDEQVYTANRDIHDLLNVYFPEYSKDRHFLAYPIGQFFAGLYRLWDWEAGEITFDLPTIRECISSGLLGPAKAELLLRISFVLEVILEQIEKYSGTADSFVEQMSKYLALYDEVTRATPNTKAAEAKCLSIYDPDTITRQEITLFIETIKKLNDCGITLFGQSHEDFVEFGEHFKRLEEFIKQRKSDLITEAEVVLINDLLGRFDFVTGSTQNVRGTFNDLRQGLHFYLKQKQDDNGSDWIVKNFEQIDGDILQSRKQNNIHRSKVAKGDRNHKRKIYHFAALSDRDMNIGIDNLLPWPLTDQFILKSYAPIDLQFQVYYSALSERSSFLRYALFYGLYFNQCDMRLSYVEQIQDEITEPYTLFSVLGVNPTAYDASHEEGHHGGQYIPEADPLGAVKPTSYNLMSMMLCPHRYLMEYVVKAKPIANSDFLYQKVFENALIAGTWARCSNKPIDQVNAHVAQIVIDEAKKLQKYYFFWQKIQIWDICRRATNYLVYEIIPKQTRFGFLEGFAGNEQHTNIRKLYGQGSIFVDISQSEPKNPYPAFEAAASKNGYQKIYKLHRFRDNAPVDASYLADMRSYLSKNITEKETVVSDWCTYCSYKNICLEPFIRKE